MKTSNQPKQLEELQKDLNIHFKNSDLLQNAFIHRSYLNEHKDFTGQSNERLEFLGDSILSIIVSKFLYENLPKSTEGELTQLRASLVRTETLAKLAQKLSLGNFLFLSKGEEDSGGRTNNSILANTFESLVGAMYLDQGLEVSQKFIEEHILTKWKTLTKTAVLDHKSKLQELVQKKFHKSPLYKLLNSWGPDHDRRFEVGAFLDNQILGKGSGRNKQAAAQDAACDAITRLKT